MTVRAQSAVLIVGLAAPVVLAGCTGSTSGTGTASGPAVTSPSASSTAPPAHSSVPPKPAPRHAVSTYGQQYLADVEPWNVATGRIGPAATVNSASVVAAAHQAIVVGRRLLDQRWPENDLSAVRALALQFDKTAGAVLAGSSSGWAADVPTLNADANVVRGELHLAPIK